MPFNFLLLLICLLFPPNAFPASQTWQPGFRTLGDWSGNPAIRLDLNIWYPCARHPSLHSFGNWQINGSLNARPAKGKFPLLIISHPSPATRFSYSGLASWLATRGFVVITPTHAKDNLDNMEDLYSWNQLEHRVKEINKAIMLAESDQSLSPVIDNSRIGLIGIGAGATSALLIGGCLPNCEEWSNYCNKNYRDNYCSSETRKKINTICKNFPLPKSLANPSIKAVALIAPEYAMFFDKAAFQYFYPPVLLIETGKDVFSARNTETLGHIFGSKALYLELRDADTGALMDECPKNLSHELPELCDSVSAAKRKSLRQNLQSALYSFFSHYLIQTANLPVIPQPPELKTRQAEPETPKTKPQKTSRRKNQKR